MNGKYRVNCISVSGRKNKSFKSGEIVTAENFSSDQLGSHIALKKVVPIIEQEQEEDQEEEEEEQKPTMELLFAFLKEGELVNVFEEQDITKNELIDYLNDVLQIEFNSAEKKSVLFQLVLDNLPK